MECDIANDNNNNDHNHNKLSFPSISSSPPRSPRTPPPVSGERSPGNGCFNCGKQGHWAKDCPTKTPKKTPPSSTPSNSIKHGSVSPMVRCPCGGGFCLIFISMTDKNPGRMFYTCPVDKKRGKCGFFKWYDQLIGITARTPMCPCGAGLCSVNKASSTDPHEEKWYFACRIKKNHGHGACEFVQWADSESSIVNDGNGRENMGCSSVPTKSDTPNNDLDKKEMSSEINVETPLAHTSERSPDLPIATAHSDQGDIPNTYKVMTDAESLDPMAVKPLQILQPIAQSQSPGFEDSQRHISFAGSTKTAGNFPSSNSVTIPEDVGMSDDEEPFHLIHRASKTNCLPSSIPTQDAQLPGIVSSEAKESAGIIIEDDKVSLKSILKTFGQVLLNQFECMNPLDPDQMLKVAEPIFIAFQRLSTECSPFVDGVKKYIHNVSLLTSIERSINEGPSSQELTKQHGIKKAQFDKVAKRHSEAEAAYLASQKHLQSLGAEVSRIQGILVKLENQLADCEAGASMLKSRMDEVSESMSESKLSMEAAFQEVAIALEVEQRRESARDAAKMALETARVWLEKL